MGYRSQVRSLIYGTKENLDTYIFTQTLILNSQILKYFRGSLSRYIIHDITDVKELHFLDLFGDSWKWDESCSDIQAWMNFMNESSEHGLQYEFIRIGEQIGDIEHLASNGSLGLIYTSNPSIETEFEPGEEIPFIL